MARLASTHENQLKTINGIVKFARLNADGSYQSAFPLSPSAELTIAISSEPTEYISAEEPGGFVLAREAGQIGRIASLTCNQMSPTVKAMFLGATSSLYAQASGTVTDEISGHVFPNTTVFMGADNLGGGVFGTSAVTVASYEGTEAGDWTTAVAYAVGDVVVPTTPNDHWYMCTVAGTSGGAEPTWTTTGATITDGPVTWQDMGVIVYTVTDDYELDAGLGQIQIPNTGAIATAISKIPASLLDDGLTFRLNVDYTKAAHSHSRIATQGDIRNIGKFWFEERTSDGNGRWYAPRAQMVPTGDLNLKTINEYGALGFEVSFLQPATGHALIVDGEPANLS